MESGDTRGRGQRASKSRQSGQHGISPHFPITCPLIFLLYWAILFIKQIDRLAKAIFFAKLFSPSSTVFFPVGSDRPDRPLVQQLSPFFSWPARVLNVLRSKISQSIYETFQRSAFGPICEKPPNIWKGNSAKESSAALSGNQRRVVDEARPRYSKTSIASRGERDERARNVSALPQFFVKSAHKCLIIVLKRRYLWTTRPDSAFVTTFLSSSIL